MARTYRRQFPRLYRNYKGDTSTTLTRREVRAAAEMAGFSPAEAKQMMQISLGESGRRPGAVGDDAAAGYGNTFGLGLVQTTPLAWGKGTAAWNYMRKLGGQRAMFNPVKQMMMAKFLYDSAGKSFQPWYGTRYLKDRDPQAKSVLGKSGPQGASYKRETTRIPGVDNSDARQQLLQEYVLNRDDPNALAALGFGLQGAQDVPGRTVTKRVPTKGGYQRGGNSALEKALQKDQNHGAKSLAEFATRGIYGSGERTPAENAAAGGATGSDHLTTNRWASAVDAKYGTGRLIAKRLGIKGWQPGTYTRHTITVRGRKYSVQILEDVAGHFDHTHVGVARIR